MNLKESMIDGKEDHEYESLPTSCMRTHMLAGAMAGVMEHVVMYPLDSVKVFNNIFFSSKFVELKHIINIAFNSLIVSNLLNK